jgi:hypothetical protein
MGEMLTWPRHRLAALAVLLALAACGGSDAADSPQAATDRALKLAARGDKVGFARTLASGPRGASTADVQLEILSEWLWMRGLSGIGLDDCVLDGWDPPQVTPGNNPTILVTTVLHFRHPTAQPAERPLPLEVDLVVEGGKYRIADARVPTIPAWYRAHLTDAGVPTGERVTLPSLVQLAAAYRPPPPDFKR